MESEQELARKKYGIAEAVEIKRYEREKELIEMQYRRRCEDTRTEHLQGLQGDIISLKKAHAAALDDTRTETGSEVDYFPHYHEFPEPDTQVRGYTSSKITDEKPFKQYLESSGDLDLQDVINEDITGPMIESIQKENAKHAKEQRIKQTQTMQALSTEATKRLGHMKGYLIPRPIRQNENDAYALSVLADVSEFMENRHPQQQYTYMPLAPGEHFPANAVPLPPHDGQGNGRPLAPAPTPVLPQPIQVTTVPSKRSRAKSKTSTSSISSIPPIRPSLSLQTQPNGVPHPHPHPHPPPPTSVVPSPIISTGPGQPIAPAPPKHLPPYSSSATTQSCSPLHLPSAVHPSQLREAIKAILLLVHHCHPHPPPCLLINISLPSSRIRHICSSSSTQCPPPPVLGQVPYHPRHAQCPHHAPLGLLEAVSNSSSSHLLACRLLVPHTVIVRSSRCRRVWEHSLSRVVALLVVRVRVRVRVRVVHRVVAVGEVVRKQKSP